MSGPPYPHPDPVPGSNAIGQFIIGVSPIGTIPAFDWWKTVISQYSNSDVLTQLFSNFFQYIDQTTNMDAFFDFIWNVDSAQGIGLDIWGRIVDVNRTLHIANADVYFGFEESTDGLGYNQAPFYSGMPTTENFDLSDTAYRTLILAKAMANISDGSIAAINQLLLNLFPGRGNCYVVDNLDMSMTYKFNFFLSPVEETIVRTSGVMPKPTGVSVDVEQVI